MPKARSNVLCSRPVTPPCRRLRAIEKSQERPDLKHALAWRTGRPKTDGTELALSRIANPPDPTPTGGQLIVRYRNTLDARTGQELDFRLAPRGRRILGNARQADCAPQPNLV